MKKLILVLSIVFIASVWPFSELKAQYPIPSYDVELYQYNATFNEEGASNNFFTKFGPREERKINIRIEDPNPNQMSWADVMIYSLDGTTELGPYTASELYTLEVPIGDGEWGLQVLNCLSGCELSVWID